MQISPNILTLDIKVQDKFREMLSKRDGNFPKLTGVILGDSDGEDRVVRESISPASKLALVTCVSASQRAKTSCPCASHFACFSPARLMRRRDTRSSRSPKERVWGC